MITAGAAAGIALVALGMVLTPGPNMVYLVSRSLSQGRRAGLVSLLGTVTGFVVFMTLANLGLAVVFVAVPWLYIGLKAAGAAYLLFLAWQTLRPGGVGLFEARDLPRDSAGRLFRMGLLTNLLNPKAAVMYLALIPQFISPELGHVAAQGFALGAIQIAVSFAVNGAIVFAAAGVASFLGRRPSWVRWQRRVTGGLLAAVGVRLAIDAPARAAA
ncbi:LysE family translocator [Glycomyces harbinensis]|uniref:Threonine/homoserine/homoserine lactone efflux protein n=1 Tax=Glycomyces harbinensis TaxID=58114 RepID=A0A1G7A4U4_9ACTN|nr:LysE family translocator [Glycomyces harbinensis]SDE09904.1 Threonine/homoserine/homoserine lactone efflux protein [Glycomyces harbinensis]